MWAAIKIIGVACLTLLVLVFLGLLVMVTRPALLVGVDDSSLGHSVARDDSPVTCTELGNGDWNCREGVAEARYRVEVDWMGCWKATRAAPKASPGEARRRDGCIELGDVITLD